MKLSLVVNPQNNEEVTVALSFLCGGRCQRFPMFYVHHIKKKKDSFSIICGHSSVATSSPIPTTIEIELDWSLTLGPTDYKRNRRQADHLTGTPFIFYSFLMIHPSTTVSSFILYYLCEKWWKVNQKRERERIKCQLMAAVDFLSVSFLARTNPRINALRPHYVGPGH